MATTAKVSEDEDGFVQLALVGKGPGGGTGWANQVITGKKGKPVSNRTTVWLTVYGLPANAKVSLELAKGACGTSRDALACVGPVRTDKLGGWTGKVVFKLGASKTWVVRGGYQVRLVHDGTIKACGMLRDDPDVGN